MDSLWWIIGTIVVGAVALGVLQAILKQVWLTFKWRVLGWKPNILDEELVTKTVDFVVENTLQNDIEDAKKAGQEHTEEELIAHSDRVRTFGRNVIELYIDRFTRK